MKIRDKVLLIFLIPGLALILLLGAQFFFLELYKDPDSSVRAVVAFFAGVIIIYIALLILAARLTEQMINFPLILLYKKIKRIESGNLEAYKPEEDQKGMYKDFAKILDNAVEALKEQRIQISKQVETKNSEISDLNKKLQVDESAAINVFKELKKIDQMKSEFISLASHQLKTPMTSMRWAIGSLLNGEQGELNESQKEYVREVYDSNQRLINLVDSLLNVSRIESGRYVIDPKPNSLAKLTEVVIAEIKADADIKNIKIEVKAHAVPEINVDANLVHNVLINIISNAIRYSPIDETIFIEIAQTEDFVTTKIEDHGIGIPEKDKSRIFEKFYRTDIAQKKVADGTGIGLYLAKAIVEALGGIIWFESEENKGTTFFFSLPLVGVSAKAGDVKLI